MQSQELAARIGIDPSAMSNIESGKRSVKASELVAIAAALSVSPLALLDEDSLPARMHLAARADGEQHSIGGRANSRLLALTELHAVLNDAGLTTTSDLADVPRLDHWSWKAVAQELAVWATKELRVDAVDIKRFARLADAIQTRFRVDVLVEEYPGDPLSGAAITDREFPLIFVNSQHPTPRSLFTLAHELGHLLLSHDGALVVDDNLAGTTQDERQANAFAAAFLMPEEKVDEYVDSYGLGAESLARMICNFGVSFESLVFRLHNLREISGEDCDSLHAIGWQGLLRVIEGSGLRQRLGPEISMRLISRLDQHPAERPPIWLANRCLTGYQQGIVSARPLAGLFNLDPEEFLDRIQENDGKSAGVLERVEEAVPGEHVSDDDLFAGSPVS